MTPLLSETLHLLASSYSRREESSVSTSKESSGNGWPLGDKRFRSAENYEFPTQKESKRLRDPTSGQGREDTGSKVKLTAHSASELHSSLTVSQQSFNFKRRPYSSTVSSQNVNERIEELFGSSAVENYCETPGGAIAPLAELMKATLQLSFDTNQTSQQSTLVQARAPANKQSATQLPVSGNEPVLYLWRI